ncbi:MAG: agmatinase [Desulfobacterales bacterium GWB2_56_26]|nr:MAG: agmatinase [Desulfobacterales bacterium GWB2_56_26]
MTNLAFLESELDESPGHSPLFQVIPVPLEETVSYGGGTARGPAAIIAASQQLERWDGVSEPLTAGIGTSPAVDCSGEIGTIYSRIEAAVRQAVEQKAIPVVLGGEHSVSLAPIRVLAKTAPGPIGIIQLDAHADLRDSFEGSPYSHACVMRRALEECGCSLMQFGVRALSREEVDYRREKRIAHLDGRALHGLKLDNFSLPATFPKNIYLTLDVDGLDPSVIGATGTPVPGGPGWYQTLTFIERAVAGRRVLGFDVVELAPRAGDHGSDFAAAQLVYSVMGIIARNFDR